MDPGEGVVESITERRGMDPAWRMTGISAGTRCKPIHGGSIAPSMALTVPADMPVIHLAGSRPASGQVVAKVKGRNRTAPLSRGRSGSRMPGMAWHYFTYAPWAAS
ncbi:hypothetical protein B9Y66_03200 [Stenotrophomonas maltophilia]|nr:hypothetical protein B9Y66_03200 [Stenotrophomonas maltophilia]